MCFVLGDYDDLDYWSLVQHCRQSPPTGSPGQHHHKYPGAISSPDWWYDLVVGPVSAFWAQRVTMADADQFGFHTDDAIEILQKLINRFQDLGDHDAFALIPVP